MGSEPVHSAEAEPAWVPIAGGVVSWMVKVLLVETALLQSSVAVKVTVIELLQPPLHTADEELLDQIRLGSQVSDAAAPPLVFSQAT